MTKILPIAVPAHAMLLLEFIYRTETGKNRPACYEVIYGHNQSKLPKPLTSMSLGEVIDAQADWTKRFKSSAAGAGQFMRATLIGIAKEIPALRGDVPFNGPLQDRLAYYLLLRRGYNDFIDGRTAIIAFGKALAQEWASFPVLADCKGAHRQVRRGQSYYAGDGLNKSLITPEMVEAMLRTVLQAAKEEIRHAPTPIAKPENSGPTPPAMTDFSPVPEPSAWAKLFAALIKLFGGSR
ncbi:hypothetical protein M0654_14120 [Rhizobium sp. NTR19]|uniref:Uncharacterized protein n=1 Tax=Neorhizobium turbinariae TaxID=2937795 RepID=A0ABT0ITI5_9HYPH|nr:hypothetical protein [Neorhizobium turbinariae]MCK8781119.1 hypothetical protein [Neorhizobium turbinariae]